MGVGIDYSTLTVRFHDGPKSGESLDLTVPAARSYPQRITVTDGERRGYYEQSAWDPALYVWDQWVGPVNSITEA